METGINIKNSVSSKVSALIALLTSDKDENDKVKEILSFLKENPGLVFSLFVFSRTFLHLVVLHRLPKLLNKLLEQPEYQQLIAKVDKNGCTAYHYVVNLKYYDETALAALIQYVPVWINHQDGKGETALYKAIKERNISAIKQLVEAGARVDIADYNGTSPWDFILHDSEIAQVILSVNSNETLITFPAMQRQINNEAIKRVTEKFSALGLFCTTGLGKKKSSSLDSQTSLSESPSSSRSGSAITPGGSHRSGSSQKSEGSFDSCPSNFEEDSPKTKMGSKESINCGNIGALNDYLMQKAESEVLIEAPALLEHAFLLATDQDKTKSEQLRNNQIQQFYLLLRFASIDILEKHLVIILNESVGRARIELLRNAYRGLAHDASSVLRNVQQQMDQLEELFEKKLYQAGLVDWTPCMSKNFTDTHYNVIRKQKNKKENESKNKKEDEIAEIVWNLCACFFPVDSEMMVGYDFVSVTDLEQIEKTEKARLYWVLNNKDFAYKVLDPNNQVQVGTISENELKKPLVVKDLGSRFKEDILRITASRGHTISVKVYVSNMIQGLLSGCDSLDYIIVLLANMWEDFTLKQKLIANFIVKELLVWDVHHVVTKGNKFDLRLMLFMKKNQGFLGPENEINTVLTQMVDLKNEFNKNITYANYVKLNICLTEQRQFSQQLIPLEQLLISAASSSSNNQKQISQIASEFRVVFLTVYQRMQLHEFYNRKSSDEKKEAQVSYLSIHAKAVDSLNYFLQRLILKAESPQDRTKIFRLLVLVAVELSIPCAGVGPDLNSIVIILTTLNAAAIMRLKPLEQLEESLQEKFNALDSIVGDTNAKDMRWIESAFLTPLLYLPLFLKDLTFICDGNKVLSQRYELLGRQYKRFLQLQKKLLHFYYQTTSNVFTLIFNNQSFLKEKIAEELYDMSCHIFPPRPSECVIDNLSLPQLLDTFRFAVNTRDLPKVIFKGRAYAPKDSLDPLIECLKNNLRDKEKTTTGKKPGSKSDLEQAKELVGKMVIIINQRYSTNKALNPTSYLWRLDPKTKEKEKTNTGLTLEPSEKSNSPVLFSSVIQEIGKKAWTLINSGSEDERSPSTTRRNVVKK